MPFLYNIIPIVDFKVNLNFLFIILLSTMDCVTKFLLTYATPFIEVNVIRKATMYRLSRLYRNSLIKDRIRMNLITSSPGEMVHLHSLCHVNGIKKIKILD